MSTHAVSPVSIFGASSAAATTVARAVIPRKTRKKIRGKILLRALPTVVSICRSLRGCVSSLARRDSKACAILVAENCDQLCNILIMNRKCILFNTPLL